MRKERTILKVAQLELNKGQLEWLGQNPRQWTKEDLERMVRSIEEDEDFLEERPALVIPHGKKYVVFCRNLGTSAAKKMGLKDMPCVIHYPETDEDRQAIRRRTLKDNGSYGKDDADILANEWDDLPLDEMGIDLPDWEDPEKADAPVEVKEDDFDETTDEIHVRCKPGDVWQLGEHRLMCGDSTDLEVVKKLMGGGRIMADMVITDPPYNVGYGYEDSRLMAQRKHRTDGLVVLNDKQENDEFALFLVKAYSAFMENLKAGGAFYIFHADNEGYNFRNAINNVPDMKLAECLVWVKDTLCLGRQDYQWRHEPCLYGWKTGGSHSWYSDRKQTTVLEFVRPKRSEEHPTMKPVALFSYLIQNSSKSGDVVLDVFGGSGTTIVACEQLGRKCCMMELDPHYCDVIIARWEKLTGGTATLLEN